MKYRIGSMCHCGFPDECFDHWQVQTDDNPVDSSVQTVIADDLTRASAELIVSALNQAEKNKPFPPGHPEDWTPEERREHYPRFRAE